MSALLEIEDLRVTFQTRYGEVTALDSVSLHVSAGETLGELAVRENPWFDDTLPPGAQAAGNEGAQSWKFGSGDNHPVRAGKVSQTLLKTMKNVQAAGGQTSSE